MDDLQPGLCDTVLSQALIGPIGALDASRSSMKVSIYESVESALPGDLVINSDGVDAERGRFAITAIAEDCPQDKVQDLAQVKAANAEQIDMIVNLVYVLLSLAVLIALLGIANTLALSIFERIRETGLLRAVGMTRCPVAAHLPARSHRGHRCARRGGSCGRPCLTCCATRPSHRHRLRLMRR